MNILIVKLSALGDVIHTLPALVTLRAHHPDATIHWLVESPALELVQGHPALDRALPWPRQDWSRRLRKGQWLRLGREVHAFVRQLRATPYDLIIDFQSLLKSAIWVAIARGRRKAGYGPGLRRNERGWLALNERVPVTDPNAHAVERNLRLLEGLGLPRQPVRYDFAIPPANDQEAAAQLAEVGIGEGTPFIAVSPMTRWPTKNWTPGHFAAVLDQLDVQGLRAVVTGSPGDRVAIDAVIAAARRPVRRIDGRTPIKTLAAVFRRARLVLSTDTGPMHLAVAVGTPVVALFGPTSPDYTGPYGPGNVVLRAGLACSPCYKKTCLTTEFEKHACMLRLKPEDVTRAIVERLAWPGAR